MSTQIEPKTATNWFEVYSSNVDSTVAFYCNVFGWTKEAMPMGPDSTYWMLKKGETTFAGVMDLNHPQLEGVPPHWGLYLHTDNCESTIAKAQDLGASLSYGPMTIPDIGIVAGFKDSEGAHFNIHQPAGERTDISSGGVNWIEQMSPNREAAVKFYTSLFGWSNNDMEMGEDVGVYSMFMIDGYPIAGCMKVPADDIPACWMMYLHSDKLEDTCEKVTANGGKVIQPPFDIGQFGRISIAADNTGAVFGIHQPPAMG